jgi:hypothetical protein
MLTVSLPVVFSPLSLPVQAELEALKRDQRTKQSWDGTDSALLARAASPTKPTVRCDTFIHSAVQMPCVFAHTRKCDGVNCDAWTVDMDG